MLTWLPSLRENFPWYWIHFHLLSLLSPLFSGKLLQEWSQSFYQLQLTPICFPLLSLLHWPHSMITRWLPNSQIPPVIWGTTFFLYCTAVIAVIPLITPFILKLYSPEFQDSTHSWLFWFSNHSFRTSFEGSFYPSTVLQYWHTQGSSWMLCSLYSTFLLRWYHDFNYMLMVPKFLFPTWASLSSHRLIYPTPFYRCLVISHVPSNQQVQNKTHHFSWPSIYLH